MAKPGPGTAGPGPSVLDPERGRGRGALAPISLDRSSAWPQGPCVRSLSSRRPRPSCLRRRCPLPEQRRALGSKSTGASAHDVPTAHATSMALGTRRPRAQPASRLEPLEKGHPPPTTLSRLLDVPGLVPTGLSSSSFRAGRRPPLWSSCTLAGLRDPHSVPCDSATAPRLCPEHTELCLPSRVPAVCLAPSHRRLRHGFFSWTRSRSGARPDVSLP